MVVLRGMSGVITPPPVSTPSESGVTSRSSTSSSRVARERGALQGGADGDDLVGVHALVRLAAEELLHAACTAGMRVMPPTSTTCLDVAGGAGRRRAPCWQGSMVRSTRSLT
jgi:hypothetical protein